MEAIRVEARSEGFLIGLGVMLFSVAAMAFLPAPLGYAVASVLGLVSLAIFTGLW